MSKSIVVPDRATEFLGSTNSEERSLRFQEEIEGAMNKIRQIKLELTSPFSASVGNISVKAFGKVLMEQSHSLVDEGIQAAEFLVKQGIDVVPSSQKKRQETAELVVRIG